jgi:anti-sigma regulatory factor (Ser/Thr protein kinase)
VRHSLLIYDNDDAMLERVAPFLGSGLVNGEPVVVVLDRARWDILGGELGSGAPVVFFDRAVFLTRPEAALASFDRAFRRLAADGASTVRVYGEPCWDAPAERDSWISFEAIFNRAFAQQPGWAVCGYDARSVPEAVLDSALETHPEVRTDRWEPNPHYREPEDVVRSRTPAPGALGTLRRLPGGGGSRDLRQRLRAELEAAAVPQADALNMLLAAGEVLANARRHGDGQPRVRAGRVGDHFVCEVSDEGPGVEDPLAGFLPPRPSDVHGAGLWVARQLTREVELVPSPQGFSVRLWT